MAEDVAIVWFRQDLRLADNEALTRAAARHAYVVPIYVWAPEEEGAWAPGAASRWWLHDSLASLATSLQRAGSDLVIRSAETAAQALAKVAAATGARTIYWNELFEPHARKRDVSVVKLLSGLGIEVFAERGAMLHPPDEIKSLAGTPYLVYGAFLRAAMARNIAEPLPAPKKFPPLPKGKLASEALISLQLKPKIAWDQGLRGAWTPGEASAQRALNSFCSGPIGGYSERRDLPAEPGTSRLGPHLHFGELSARQAWTAARSPKVAKGGAAAAGVSTFLREILWREFSYYLLHHHPHLTEAPLRKEFEAFPWEDNPAALKAWQRGRTGYPIVDAGMRELWHTGWMHNRVRMIVASFLVKDLRVHWLEGARWFWDTLVDADLASNTQGWQWTSGCGADAAPYFRVFNPTLQGKKFDPDGVYVRQWIPELKGVPKASVHEPWKLKSTNGYPAPIVDHDRARFIALKAFDSIKKRN